jgi:hypothetical protein
MTLAQLVNTTYALLIEGLDEEGERVLDDSLNGITRPSETQGEAFARAHGQRPRRGAPTSFTRERAPEAAAGPPPMPEGYKLAPVGVQVREPTPTRGLEVLAAAFGKAPKPSKAKPARETKGD